MADIPLDLTVMVAPTTLLPAIFLAVHSYNPSSRIVVLVMTRVELSPLRINLDSLDMSLPEKDMIVIVNT